MKIGVSCLALAACMLHFAAAANASSRLVDVQHSSLTVYVYKTGLFAFAADNHEIAAPIASGRYDDAAKHGEIDVQAAQLRVLDPGLSADKRAGVQSTMLSARVLDAAKYPAISFRITNITQSDAKHWTIMGNLTLHGETRPIGVQAIWSDRDHLMGNAALRQTAFGITPIKVAGGLASVKDEVRVEFALALLPPTVR